MGKRKQGKWDGEGGGGGKRKKAGYFATNTKVSLPKCRGFLVSCWSGKEQQASREAIELLQEYYEKLSLDKAPESTAAPASDIAAALANEVEELKQQSGKLFGYHSTGVSGLAYITMRADAEGAGPVEIVTALAEDVQKAKQCKSRMCIRFIPVEVVCHADLADIKKAAKTLIEQHFPAEESSPSVSFAVFYEHRASVKLDRMEVINSIVDEIPQPPHKVNLSSPEKTIIVQVLKSSAALSVAPKHRELMRFNLRELSTTDEEQVKAAREAKERERESQAAQANGATEAAEGEEIRTTAANEESSCKETPAQEPDAKASTDKVEAQHAEQGEGVAQGKTTENDGAEA